MKGVELLQSVKNKIGTSFPYKYFKKKESENYGFYILLTNKDDNIHRSENLL